MKHYKSPKKKLRGGNGEPKEVKFPSIELGEGILHLFDAPIYNLKKNEIAGKELYTFTLFFEESISIMAYDLTIRFLQFSESSFEDAFYIIEFNELKFTVLIQYLTSVITKDEAYDKLKSHSLAFDRSILLPYKIHREEPFSVPMEMTLQQFIELNCISRDFRNSPFSELLQVDKGPEKLAVEGSSVGGSEVPVGIAAFKHEKGASAASVSGKKRRFNEEEDLSQAFLDDAESKRKAFAKLINSKNEQSPDVKVLGDGF